MKQCIRTVCTIALVAAAGCASNPTPPQEPPPSPQINAAMPRAHCGDAPAPHLVVLLNTDALTARRQALARWCEEKAGHLYDLTDPRLAGHIERPKGIQVPNLEDFYPVEARRRGYQGTILLMARVDPDGSVGAVVVLVSSGYKILDASAMGHIAHARFGIGPRLDGKPVSAVGYEPVYYYLDNWSKAHWGGPPPPLDQKVATQLAFATAGCKHPDDCDVRGHLEGNNWVFVVSLVRVRDVEGKPLAAPGGGWVEFTIDPEGHISHKKAGD